MKFTLLCLVCSLLLVSCATQSADPGKQEKLATIHYRLGMDALGKQGMLPKAFDELMKSNQLQPDRPEVLDALGYAWLLRGDVKTSESYYKRAIRQGAGPSTYNNYANMLNRAERYQEAEQAARKALDDPRYPKQDLAFINLGDALSGQNSVDAAIGAYQQAQIFNPESLLVKLKLANVYFKKGMLRESRVLYEMLLLKRPNSRPAVEGLIAVLGAQHAASAARKTLTSFIEHTSDPLDKAWAQNELERMNR